MSNEKGDEILIHTAEAIGKRLGGVSRKTVLRWIKTEGLPAFKDSPNGPYRITLDSLKAWSRDFQYKYYNIKNYNVKNNLL